MQAQPTGVRSRRPAFGGRLMRLLPLLAGAAAMALASASAGAELQTGELVPTGQRITPTAAPGSLFQRLDPAIPGLPDYRAGQASALALSPDGKTLLILTSGFNRWFTPQGTVRP